MPIIVEMNPTREYELLSEGLHAAVLADVVDLGMQPGFQGGKPKHKVRFVWLTDEADTRGYTKRAFATYSISLHEKATLTKTLRQMKVNVSAPKTGKFDLQPLLESLVGRQQGLVIQHNTNEKEGKTYANIASIMAPNPRSVVDIPSDFKRKSADSAATSQRQPGDDDIPF